MEIEIPNWFRLEYLAAIFGGGLIFTLYKFAVKADEIYDAWFRKSSKERFSKYVTDGFEKVTLLDSVDMAKGLVDKSFYHGSNGRPRLKRTALFSAFAFVLGLVFSFTYYDRFLIPGDDQLNYAWFAVVFCIIVGLNLIFDFCSVWFTRFCLSKMVTTARVYVFSVLDFVVSAILSPFFWLSILAFLYIPTPIFDMGMGSWPTFFESTNETPQASEVSTSADGTGETVFGLEEFMGTDGIDPTYLDFANYSPPPLSWSDRWFWFTFSLQFGVLVEFLRGPDAVFHTSHVHFYHIIGASLLLGSLFSSILTSLGVWFVYSSFLVFRVLRILISPVAFASRHIDLAVENRPLGCIIAVNGLIILTVFGIFTLLTL